MCIVFKTPFAQLYSNVLISNRNFYNFNLFSHILHLSIKVLENADNFLHKYLFNVCNFSVEELVHFIHACYIVQDYGW